MPIVDPVQTPGLAQFLTDTAFDPAQSHRDIDAFLATRPGGHTISDIVADGLYDPRLEVLESIARTSEHPEGCRYGMAGRTAFARAVVHAMACAGVDALLYPNTRMLPPLACEVAEGRWTHATFPTNAGIAAQSDLPSVCIPAGFTDTAYRSVRTCSVPRSTRPTSCGSPTTTSERCADGAHHSYVTPRHARQGETVESRHAEASWRR